MQFALNAALLMVTVFSRGFLLKVVALKGAVRGPVSSLGGGDGGDCGRR